MYICKEIFFANKLLMMINYWWWVIFLPNLLHVDNIILPLIVIFSWSIFVPWKFLKKGIFNFQICTHNPLFPQTGTQPHHGGGGDPKEPLQHLTYITYTRSPSPYLFIVCTPAPCTFGPCCFRYPLHIYSFLSPWFSPPHLIAPSSKSPQGRLWCHIEYIV